MRTSRIYESFCHYCDNESEVATQAELANLVGHEGSESSDDQSETSDSICTAKTIGESPGTETSRDLDSLKVAESRDLAKARGVFEAQERRTN